VFTIEINKIEQKIGLTKDWTQKIVLKKKQIDIKKCKYQGLNPQPTGFICILVTTAPAMFLMSILVS
jgi:hypothetical protein